MNRFSVKSYVKYLYMGAILFFILNKLYFRPWVLANEQSDFLQIFVLSFPNFVEAFIGTLLLAGIFLYTRPYIGDRLGRIKDTHVHLIAVLTAAVYTISQEYKFHNLGGNNVFDDNDVIASIIGLVIAFTLIQTYGLLRTENENERSIE